LLALEEVVAEVVTEVVVMELARAWVCHGASAGRSFCGASAGRSCRGASAGFAASAVERQQETVPDWVYWKELVTDWVSWNHQVERGEQTESFLQ